MMPIYRDIEVWRGSSLPPVAWDWPQGYAGSIDCQLTVWVGATLLLTASGGRLVADAGGRRTLWDLTSADSRMIPLGRIARYEIEERHGGERTIWAGTVIGLGGDNLDGPDPAPTGMLDYGNPYDSAIDLDGWM